MVKLQLNMVLSFKWFFLVAYPEIFVIVLYRCLEGVGRRWISCNKKGFK